MIAVNDIGMLWYTTPMPVNFILKLQWRRNNDQSGVFIRIKFMKTSPAKTVAKKKAIKAV
ncbi:hypothetical protein MNBD_GAMMA12-2964 [hydrothermal vent metagenome]|uniref:Uncharacterized protein n=1 Tax=hydrothermal vent metagenome TaxID=652676 RepID=A0A3B0XUG5_9ZZZZ